MTPDSFLIERNQESWLAYDGIIIDERDFFLMEHTTYGRMWQM